MARTSSSTRMRYQTTWKNTTLRHSRQTQKSSCRLSNGRHLFCPRLQNYSYGTLAANTRLNTKSSLLRQGHCRKRNSTDHSKQIFRDTSPHSKHGRRHNGLLDACKSNVLLRKQVLCTTTQLDICLRFASSIAPRSFGNRL